MKRAGVALLLWCGCEAAPPSPAPAPETPAAPTPAPAAAEPASTPEPTPALQPPAPPSLCVRMCEHQAQARAVGADMIRRDCDERCATGPTDTCKEAAREARARVEAVPMRKRAARVWAELAKPDLYCGYSDPLLRGLSAAATDDLASRADALARALELDPFETAGCPLPPDATAATAIAECELDEPAEPWHPDVDATSFFAIRAVRLRLEALGLHADDRRILINTVVLSTALGREK